MEPEARLQRAFAEKDNPTLVALYQGAGEAALAEGRTEDGLVMLVHAYVYALEWGMVEAEEIHRVLKAHGREE